MDPVTGLATGRIALGLVSFASPDLAAKLFSLDARDNPVLPYMSRLFGAREVALGAATLLSSGPFRRQLVQIGVAVDAADVVTGVASASTGAVSARAGGLLAAVAAGAVATGVRELQA